MRNGAIEIFLSLAKAASRKRERGWAPPLLRSAGNFYHPFRLLQSRLKTRTRYCAALSVLLNSLIPAVIFYQGALTHFKRRVRTSAREGRIFNLADDYRELISKSASLVYIRRDLSSRSKMLSACRFYVALKSFARSLRAPFAPPKRRRFFIIRDLIPNCRLRSTTLAFLFQLNMTNANY